MHEATAVVVGEPDHPLVTIDHGDWTYAVKDSVPYWVDAHGEHHHGWPSCLEPHPIGTGTQVPREVPIRFGVVDVDVEWRRWRQVVMVDCRPA